MRKLKGYLLMGSARVACPCHLPITLPLLTALFAGTALGAFLLNNVWLVVAISTAYFIAALALGLRDLGQHNKTCQLADTEERKNPKWKTNSI